MKIYSVLLIVFGIMLCCCVACGPRKFKKYECTISGTVYGTKETKKPMQGCWVYMEDETYDETTYGMSFFWHPYSQKTNEQGQFSFDIKSGGMTCWFRIMGTYDRKGDSIVNVPLDCDSIYFENFCYVAYASKKAIFSQMQDIDIHIVEDAMLQVSPATFTNKQEVTITLPQHERVGIGSISICHIKRNPDTIHSLYGNKVYTNEWDKPFMGTSITTTIPFPDNIEEGQYVLLVVTNQQSYYAPANREVYSRIVELRNE